MVVIKDASQLKPMLDTVKAVENINKQAEVITTAVGGDDGLARFERIINGINELSKNFLQLKQASTQGQAGQIIDQVPARGQAYKSADEHFALERQARKDKTERSNEQVKQVLKQLIIAADQHINQCAAENPNMTLAEVIDKIDVNATQLKALMLIVKSQL